MPAHDTSHTVRPSSHGGGRGAECPLSDRDHIVIVGYFVLLTLIGFYFWRRMRHVRDFFAGGNNVPWWLTGISFYLTGFSAFTFVAYSEMAYRFGFVAMTLAWSSAVAMLAGTIFLAARWQRARIISPVEFLEARLQSGTSARCWPGPASPQGDRRRTEDLRDGHLRVGGDGLRPEDEHCCQRLVMLLYTFMGGLWAVVVTDFVQFIVLTLGVVVLFPLVFGGWRIRRAVRGRAGRIPSPVGAPFSPLYVFRVLSPRSAQLQRQLGVRAEVLQRSR